MKTSAATNQPTLPNETLGHLRLAHEAVTAFSKTLDAIGGLRVIESEERDTLNKTLEHMKDLANLRDFSPQLYDAVSTALVHAGISDSKELIDAIVLDGRGNAAYRALMERAAPRLEMLRETFALPIIERVKSSYTRFGKEARDFSDQLHRAHTAVLTSIDKSGRPATNQETLYLTANAEIRAIIKDLRAEAIHEAASALHTKLPDLEQAYHKLIASLLKAPSEASVTEENVVIEGTESAPEIPSATLSSPVSSPVIGADARAAARTIRDFIGLKRTIELLGLSSASSDPNLSIDLARMRDSARRNLASVPENLFLVAIDLLSLDPSLDLDAYREESDHIFDDYDTSRKWELGERQKALKDLGVAEEPAAKMAEKSLAMGQSRSEFIQMLEPFKTRLPAGEVLGALITRLNPFEHKPNSLIASLDSAAHNITIFSREIGNPQLADKLLSAHILWEAEDKLVIFSDAEKTRSFAQRAIKAITRAQSYDQHPLATLDETPAAFATEAGIASTISSLDKRRTQLKESLVVFLSGAPYSITRGASQAIVDQIEDRTLESQIETAKETVRGIHGKIHTAKEGTLQRLLTAAPTLVFMEGEKAKKYITRLGQIWALTYSHLQSGDEFDLFRHPRSFASIGELDRLEKRLQASRESAHESGPAESAQRGNGLSSIFSALRAGPEGGWANPEMVVAIIVSCGVKKKKEEVLKGNVKSFYSDYSVSPPRDFEKSFEGVLKLLVDRGILAVSDETGITLYRIKDRLNEIPDSYSIVKNLVYQVRRGQFETEHPRVRGSGNGNGGKHHDSHPN